MHKLTLIGLFVAGCTQAPATAHDPVIADIATSPTTQRDTGIARIQIAGEARHYAARALDESGEELTSMTVDWQLDATGHLETVRLQTPEGAQLVERADGTIVTNTFDRLPAFTRQLFAAVASDLVAVPVASGVPLTASCGASLIGVIAGGVACGGSGGLACAFLAGAVVKALDSCG